MKLANTAYIDIETVLDIHAEQLAAHGGQDGIRDRHGLESAVELPRQGFGDGDFYPTIFDKAAVYAFHIAEAQAFVDGNKRTALAVALTFLAINDYPILMNSDELYEAMIGVATKQVNREALAYLFRKLYIESNI
jgi:death-on-curing protein